jgi:hypothetical protein
MRSPCCLCIPYFFFVFYAVRVVWKEIGRLLLPRTCFDLKQRFGEWILPLPSGEEPIQLGQIDRASPCLRKKSGSVSRQTWSANEDLHMDANFICCRHKRRNTRPPNVTRSASWYDAYEYIPIHFVHSAGADANPCLHTALSSPPHIAKATLMECRCTAEARQGLYQVCHLLLLDSSLS